jgi:hypothetical protein
MEENACPSINIDSLFVSGSEAGILHILEILCKSAKPNA